jgi:hypothetical protein
MATKTSAEKVTRNARVKYIGPNRIGVFSGRIGTVKNVAVWAGMIPNRRPLSMTVVWDSSQVVGQASQTVTQVEHLELLEES